MPCWRPRTPWPTSTATWWSPIADCPLTERSGDRAAVRSDGQRNADVAVLGFEAANPVRLRPPDPGAGPRAAAHRRGEGRGRHVKQVKHCNSGVLAADRAKLFDMLANVGNDNAKGEYYLTDVVGLAHDRKLSTRAAFAPEASVQGVNSQAELAAAEAVWQKPPPQRPDGRGRDHVRAGDRPPELGHQGRRRDGGAVRGLRPRRQRRDRRGDQGLQPPGRRGRRRRGR
jgi:hypothetical protein